MIKGKLKEISVYGLWEQLVPIAITEDMIQSAIDKGCTMGELKNSITEGEGNPAGFLGEEILKKYLNISSRNTYEYDMIFKDKKIEVKTKRTEVAPLPNYECSVAAYNTKQKCDFYFFTRVTYDLTQGWIIGYLSKDEFYKNARFSKKGTYEADNNYTEKADCWKLKAKETHSVKQFI